DEDVNAPARVPASPSELRQQLDIETPEHVAVRLELAGVGSRAAAALVDTVIVFAVLVGLQFAAGATGLWHVGAALEGWVLALVILLSFPPLPRPKRRLRRGHRSSPTTSSDCSTSSWHERASSTRPSRCGWRRSSPVVSKTASRVAPWTPTPISPRFSPRSSASGGAG